MPPNSSAHRRRTSRQACAEASPAKAKTTQNTPTKIKSADNVDIDVGKSRGIYDSDSIREKVLKWQKLAEDNAPESDNAHIWDADKEEEMRSPNSPKASSHTRKNNIFDGGESRAAVGKPSTPLQQTTPSRNLGRDMRHASAPPKRVVSDEHWKISRLRPRETVDPIRSDEEQRLEQMPVEDSAPRLVPKKSDAWVRKRPLPNTPDKHGPSKVIANPADHTQDARLRSDVDYNSDDEKTKAVSRSAGLGKKDERSKQRRSSVDPKPAMLIRKRRKSESRTAPQRSTVDPASQSPGHYDARKTDRQKRVGQPNSPIVPLDDGLEVDEDAELPVPPNEYGSRIEAWLIGTSDPFLDEPPKSRSMNRPTSGKFMNSDQDHQRKRHQASPDEPASPSASSLDHKMSSRRHAGSRETTYSPQGVYSEDTSPTVLKRNGARRTLHSPERMSPGTTRKAIPSPSRTVQDDVDIKSDTVPLKEPPSAFDRFDRRTFPATGNRLSTIASVETFRTKEGFNATPVNFTQKETSSLDPTRLSATEAIPELSNQESPTLASHADLVSMLSVPNGDGKTIKSARSTRVSRNRATAVNADDLMKELATDEIKYFRELRTLVDGVIPVLLSCVLSKSNVSVATGLFGGTKDATTPIVNMGIALERLNSTHRRIPTNSPEALLVWAQSAHRVYMDYIKAWKMGFQDVVVNLAPAEPRKPSGPMAIPRKPVPGKENDLPQDGNGDVVGTDGERVDVAFLLKRPLVRLKYLAKTFKDIQQLNPTEQAELWSSRFQELVLQAKKKQNEERARLEDEAAARIDTTRAREPQTLAPLVGAQIDPTRCVRARDYFDLKLYHSSGQQVDCHVELLFRDNADKTTGRGDVLICEVDSTARWLLFPPIQQDNMSIRRGDSRGEIVAMIRGSYANGQEWREIFSLTSNDDQAGEEWIQMLGSYPAPPAAPSVSAFSTALEHQTDVMLAQPSAFGIPSPSEIDVPIGEQPTEISKQLHFPSTIPSLSQDRPMPLRYRTKLGDGQRPVSMPAPLPDSNSPFGGSSRSGSNQKHHSEMAEAASREPRPQHKPARPNLHRQTSLVPAADLPTIPRVRKDAGISSAPSTPLSKRHSSDSPSNLHKGPAISRKDVASPNSSPPRTPHRGLGSSPPRFSPPGSGSNTKRRSSSPLKHEYAPSSPSGSSIGGGGGGSRSDDEGSITSDSSADDVVPSMLPIPGSRRAAKPHPPESLYTAPGANTLSPSQSASQSPYRTVPQQSGLGPKTIASIFCWSDKGLWERLHPDECSIVVTPGLIEAFEMSAAHSSNTLPMPDGSPSQRPVGVQPLVALELTPLVPLRRGTAIDISIRSPPTSASQIKSGNNIMFRSRNGQECEVLYNMINHSRINNPTYMALQNARGPNGESNWAHFMDRRASLRTGSGSANSWWRFGSKPRGGYRAGSARRTRSVSGETESSIATMSSAFSALRRFSTNGNRIFNVAKSTITSRAGGAIGIGGNVTRSSTTFSSSGNSGGSGDTPDQPTLPPELLENGSTPLGLTNQKIRLYAREVSGKWRDMGSARLTIMHPPRSTASGPLTPARQMMQERRVVVIGKTQGERLLDVTLGETSFERVGRTGIAVSVWEQLVGPNGELGTVGKTGGVAGTRVKVYMIQLKSEAETAYTFSLVGRLRY